MRMSEVKQKAAALHLKTDNGNKSDLIRAIQTAEGNSPCFGKAKGTCVYKECCWRGDCLAN